MTAPTDAPSVVLILLDDMGYAASSAFGGPVRTPDLERLATQGLRYTRFHVAPSCSPTRAALLSGRNSHRVGFGSTSYGRFPGYNGLWPKEAAPVAEVLRRHGYSTAAFGKWHNTPRWEISPVGPFDRWPTGLGFEYFYGFMEGADNQWEPVLYRNTTPVDAPREAGTDYHLTTNVADDAIAWLQTHQSLAPAKPYFLYFAPGATHEPHQVAQRWADLYRGRFDGGWDRLRGQILERQKAFGIIPSGTTLPPRPLDVPAWERLSNAERALAARQMEVYAGFLAHTDYEVGRLIRAAERLPGGQNTLVLYIVGDNGAWIGGRLGHDDLGTGKTAADRLRSLPALGGPEFINDYAGGWGWALTTPFKGSKGNAAYWGGTRNPLVVSWPARIRDRGGLRSQFTHVNDVAATLYEVAGIEAPKELDGVQQAPLDGVSFAYSFDQPQASSRHQVQLFESGGSRAIYQDGWVATVEESGKAPERWELYQVEEDFNELRNLAARYPQKLEVLRALFEVEARRSQVYPLRGDDERGTPELLDGRNEWTFYPGVPRLPATHFQSRFAGSHRIEAQLQLPAGGADGLVVSLGSRVSGFALYLKNGQAVYELNSMESGRERIAAALPSAGGAVTLAYEFVREAPLPGVNFERSAGGVGRLWINGALASEAVIQHAVGPFFGSFDVNRMPSSPVSATLPEPFRNPGPLQRVILQFK